MSDDRVTTGEIYRVLLEVKDAVKEQNGRVRTLENQMKVLWVAAVAIGAIAMAWAKKTLGL